MPMSPRSPERRPECHLPVPACVEHWEKSAWHATGMAPGVRTVSLLLIALVAGCGACSSSSSGPTQPDSAGQSPPPADQPDAGPAASGARFPLAKVADVDLPGAANRFDYQDIDPGKNHLVIAHMNDASVVVADLKDGSVVKVIPNMPTARGVVIADDVGRIFVTIQPDTVAIIDNSTLAEIKRVPTGKAPDGIGWDPKDKIVGVSDQRDGAISLIPNSGEGTRKQIPLGAATGNVVYDASRSMFWITVEMTIGVDQLMGIDPVGQKIATKIDLPGCKGAHGLRIHPDNKSALIACEGNNALARVLLDGNHDIVTADTGDGPDVLSIDPGYGLLYVAAESGDLVVFDIGKPGLVVADKQHIADNAHTVSVDPATHRVFFPLEAGPKGTPALRIMRPSGP